MVVEQEMAEQFHKIRQVSLISPFSKPFSCLTNQLACKCLHESRLVRDNLGHVQPCHLQWNWSYSPGYCY
jgi:hypothetical protein